MAHPLLDGELNAVLTKLEAHFGTDILLGDGADMKARNAIGTPLDRVFRLAAGPARQHIDLFGDDEGRIEADAELTDQRLTALDLVGRLEKPAGA